MRHIVAEDHDSAVFWITEVVLKGLLEVQAGDIVAATSSTALLDLVTEGQGIPAVVILDLVMPGNLKRLPLLREVIRRNRNLRVLAHSGSESPLLVEALLDEGALGFVSKGSRPDVVATAIQAVRSGEQFIDPKIDISMNSEHLWRTLTPREAEVLILYCKDMKAPEVAHKLGLKATTVYSHKMAGLKKLRLKESAGLSTYLLKQDLTYLLDE